MAKITDEERRLIDAAVAEGRVQKIKRGESAFGYIWDEEKSSLVPRSDNKASYQYGRVAYFETAEIRSRRAKVRTLIEARFTTGEIIEKLRAEGYHVTDIILRNDMKRLGLKPVPVAERQKRLDSERLKEFYRLLEDGIDNKKEMMKLLGLSSNGFNDWMRRCGLDPNSHQFFPATRRSPSQRS